MCCIVMSSSFAVNLLKSIGLLQLGYIFSGSETLRNEWVRNVSGNSDVNIFTPALKPWEMSRYVIFMVTVMLIYFTRL